MGDDDVEQNVQSSIEAPRACSARCPAAVRRDLDPFWLRRLLPQDNEPVRNGSRALDILVASVGDLVAKQELMARVWPNTFVEPANLKVHIAALRRARYGVGPAFGSVSAR